MITKNTTAIYTISNDPSWIMPARYLDPENGQTYYVRGTMECHRPETREQVEAQLQNAKPYGYGYSSVAYMAPEEFKRLPAEQVRLEAQSEQKWF